MIVQDVLDLLELKYGEPKTFIRPEQLFNLIMITQSILQESELFEVVDSWTLSTGQSSYTLPTGLYKIKELGFLDADSDELTIENTITYVEQQMLTLESEVPEKFVIFDGVIYFDAQTSEDLTIVARYSSTYTGTITEATNLKSIISQWQEIYWEYLKDLLELKFQGNQDEYERKFRYYVRRIKLDQAKDHLNHQKFERNFYKTI